MEPMERLEKMLDLTERLSDLTEAENLALAEYRPEDIEDMLEDKATLARLYENSMKALLEVGVEWDAVDAELRDKLRIAAERLTKAVDENTVRLEIGMKVNKQVIDLFAEAVKESVPHSGTYSRRGRAGNEGAKASANSVAVALDESL